MLPHMLHSTAGREDTQLNQIFFFISAGVLLLAHAYVASRVGLKLFGKALLSVFIIPIASILGSIAYISPQGNLEHSIIFLTIVLCIEDFVRTWFVTSRTRKGIGVGTASLAFAIAISFIEITIHTIEVKIYGIFPSYSNQLMAIIIDITRPVDHYFLCISLYYAYQKRIWIIISTIIISHIARDLIPDIIWDGDALSSYAPILGISLLFTLLWCLTALWIRTRYGSDSRR